MQPQVWQPNCPLPSAAADDCITLAHGEGGRLMRRLIAEEIVPELDNPLLATLADAASLPRLAAPPVFTTDSFVVSPLFFPGGDIGRLAVFGTVNDLAVSGARPRWLSLSLILEEGLPLADLRRVVRSVAQAAREADVLVVTGDTKVVPRGAADRLFITTAGIGELVWHDLPGPVGLRPGDEILVSGPVGRHGVAVLAAREHLGFEPPPETDCAPLWAAVECLRQAGVPARALRDATRGGVAAVLHEWSHASGTSIVVDEEAIPVSAEVRGACELLGLDPLFIANEGTMVVAVEAGAGDAATAALARLPLCAGAARIGRVRAGGAARATIRRALGREQALDEPLGAPLPRIC